MDLHDLGGEGHAVLPQAGEGDATAQTDIHGVGDAAAQPQMINARRHLADAILQQQQIDGAAARNQIQLSSDGLFHCFGTSHQKGEVFPAGQHAVHAGMVGAHAPQAQVGQALAKDCQFHQLGDVIYTFPQIAHVQHEDHARKGVMLYSFVVQRFQHIFVCVQAQVGIPGSVFQIPTGRTAGQKGLGIGKGLLQRLQMLSPGHAQLGTAALFVGLRHLQVAVGKLDDSGNRNAVIGTNITQHLCICAHGVQIDL